MLSVIWRLDISKTIQKFQYVLWQFPLSSDDLRHLTVKQQGGEEHLASITHLPHRRSVEDKADEDRLKYRDFDLGQLYR